jgi:2-polyprenyl-3-methyl-5-hydroxy-6-metoxy-1,4-benzoquinol methylase
MTPMPNMTVTSTAPSPASALVCSCATIRVDTVFDAEDPVTREHFTVVRCVTCGLSQTAPAPTPKELDRYYPQGYHHAARRYRLGLDRTLSLVQGSRVRRIAKLAGGPGRVLDIGCGPGWLLERMRGLGWQVRGTERSSDAARHAREVLHLDVRAQDLDEVAAEGVTYDAVVLWHVAEHLHTPGDALRRIAGLLRPGGVLVVAVPNFASPEARLGRNRWFHLDVPRHLSHFTPATLTSMLVEAGFRPRRVVHLAPEYDLFSFVQTAENLLGLPPNLLYDVVRRSESRLRLKSLPLVATATAIGVAVPLTFIAIPWSLLAAALRRGATVTVYAQRI